MRKLLVVCSGLLLGCQGPSSPVAAPPTRAPATVRGAVPARPANVQPPVQAPVNVQSPANVQQQTAAERSTAYSRAHPWGDDTGTARLRGVLSWEGSEPPAPMWRPALTLRGLLDTASARLFYRVRTNEKGEFLFDRIKGGQFRLSDRDGKEVHWRLKVEIAEGEEKTVNLSAANSVKNRDDFPDEDKALPSESRARRSSPHEKAAGSKEP